jgi:hypothetical protein
MIVEKPPKTPQMAAVKIPIPDCQFNFEKENKAIVSHAVVAAIKDTV